LEIFHSFSSEVPIDYLVVSLISSSGFYSITNFQFYFLLIVINDIATRDIFLSCDLNGGQWSTLSHLVFHWSA